MKTILTILFLITFQCNAQNSIAKIKKINFESDYRNDVLVVTFDQPLQRIASSNIPISVSPEIKCHWSWIDQYNLACNLNDFSQYDFDNSDDFKEQSLKIATQYVFSLNSGLFDVQDRKVLPQSTVFNFKRPKVNDFSIRTWNSPRLPVLAIQYNQHIDKSDIYSRIFLTADDGESISVEEFPEDELRNIDDRFYGYSSSDHYVFIKPMQKLDLNKEYNLSIKSGIKSITGPLKSIDQTINKPIKAIGKFEFSKYYCSDGINRYAGPCYADDKMHMVFSSLIDKISLFKCKYYDSSNSYLSKVDATSVLTFRSNPANQSILEDCYDEIRDVFSRKLNRSDNLEFPQTTNIRPYLTPNFSNYSIIPSTEEIDLRVQSTNLDSYYVTYDLINHEIINIQNKVNVDNKNDNDSILHSLPLPKPEDQIHTIKGYVSIVENPQEDSQKIPFMIQKSPYQINIKQNLNSMLLQVNDIYSAKSIVGAEISIDYEGSTFTSKTDNSGTSEIELNDFVENSDFILAIKKGDHIIKYPSVHRFINRIKKDGERYSNFLNEENSIYVSGISDKPIYRAGETVNYKLYLRQKKDTRFIVPNQLLPKFKLILDSEHVDCYDYDDCPSSYVLDNPKQDEFGGISGKIKLPKSLKNGQYSLEAIFNNYRIESTSDFRFQVSDFKNSEYKLKLSSTTKYVKNNDAFPIVAKAEYYSGGHVTDGKGEIAGIISPKRIDSEYPEYQAYRFHSLKYKHDEPYYLKGLSYDSNGTIKAPYTPPNNSIKFGTLKLNAGLKPEAGEWNYSQDLVLPYRQQDYFLGLKFKSWLNKINEDIHLESVFIDYLGKKQKPKSIEYFIKQKHINLWTDYKPLACIKKFKYSCVFNLEDKGSYLIKAVALKKKERVEQEINLYVRSTRYHSTAIRPEISFQSDKNHYQIGDTATISVGFPEKINKVLVTTERNHILDKWVIQTQTGHLEIKLPITSKHAPGFDVTVLTQQNNKLNRFEDLKKIDQTSHYISVEQANDKKLFKIKTDSKAYKPKQNLQLNIQSKTNLKSDYTIAVIDQSVVDLINSKQYYDLTNTDYFESRNYWDLYNNYQLTAFYTYNHYNVKLKHESDILTFNDLDYYGEDLVELSPVFATGSAIGREDFEASPNRINGILENKTPSLIKNKLPQTHKIGEIKISPKDLRFVFAESAFFKTGIQLEPGGNKNIDIPLPDNITQWRIVVLGTDISGKLEINDLSVKASKDIELRSTLPVQLTESDQFVAQYSIVSKKSRKVNMLTAVQANQNETVLNTNQHEIKKVKKLQSKTLTLDVDNIADGKLNMTALVKTKKNTDGLSQTIPVRSKTTELSLSQYGQFNTASKSLDLNIPKISIDEARLSLQMSNSLMPYLQPVYDYMDNYVHSCWEQQTAKAIVSAIQLESLHSLSQNQIQEKKKQINATLNRAIDFQAPNGGMTFFNADNNHVNLFLSLNTLSNFSFLQQLGYKVPPLVKSNLIKFISDNLLNNENLPASVHRFKEKELDTEILLKAYLYAEHNDIIEHSNDKKFLKKQLMEIKSNAINNTSKLSLVSLTQLLYLFEHDNENLKLILKAIRNKFYSNEKKYTLKDSGYSPWYLMPSDAKDHCELMNALLETNLSLVSKGDLYKHINGILENKTLVGDFGNTLENSVCSQALFAFSKKYESLNQSPHYMLNINDKNLKVENGQFTKNISLNKDLNIIIENPNQVQTYFSTQLKYQMPSENLKQQSIGFNIQREYFVFNQGSWEPALTYQVGDWIKTRITIHSPISRKFVAVSDPVPGAWLPTDPILARNMPIGMRESLKSFDNSVFFYERQLNPATTRFYADYLPAGSHIISYLSQIRSEGNFSALPALVEEMYDDENRANTEITNIIVDSE